MAVDPAFVESTVEPKMGSLETRRKAATASIYLLLLPQALMLLVLLGVIPLNLGGGALFGLWFGSMIVCAIAAAVLAERYRGAYQREVIVPLLKRADPTATYQPQGQLDPAVLDATALVPSAPNVDSENRLVGNLNGVPYQLSNVHLWRMVGSDERQRRETIFRGLFLQIALPYTVNGLTCVMSDDKPHPSRALRDALQSIDLQLSDAFEEQYDIYTTSPSDARAILTPDVATRLAEYGEDSDYPLRIAFHDGFVSVAIECGDVLEASITGGRTAAHQAAFEIDGVFTLMRSLIDVLQIQAGRFAPRPAPAAVFGAVAADAGDAGVGEAAAGASTVAGPWDQHGRAKPTGDVRQLAEKARSAGVAVDLEGTSAMTLSFGPRPSFFYGLFMGLLWTTLAVNVAGLATGAPVDGSLLLRLTSAVPLLMGVVNWLTQYHPVTTAIVLIMGLVSLANLVRHVRRASFTKSSIVTSRLVWPVARRQALAGAPTVTLVQGGGVYVGRVRVTPPLPFEAGQAAAHLIAGFLGVDAAVPIKEPTFKVTTYGRVGRKRYPPA